MFGIVMLISAVVGVLYAIYDKCSGYYLARKEQKNYEKALFEEQLEREREEQKEIDEKRKELCKRLKSVQYQLGLLDSLDDYVNRESTDEKDIKKALTLEKQYASLYQKERKLKAELERL